jgi:Rrf2 family transcriptional regulator, iron-sulfur cluster assembly transcription factor
MFSQTVEYAVRAAIDIATRPEGKNVLASEMAESLGIPAHYLSKILQQLARSRVLKSVRGRQGGFSLARPAEKIRLREIIEPFEDMHKYEECILGQPVCSEAGACPLHDFWGEVRQRYLDELDNRTLAELSEFQLMNLKSMSPHMRRKVANAPGLAALRDKKPG